ncbi:MAG: hypothetical protein IMZ62_00530 [Chloroflexi bacterium]|nr:hypothetical protein [Chloroflexota bacterium]
MSITRHARHIEFRDEVGDGVRVVEVYHDSETLRVVAYSETPAGGRKPLTMFIDDLVALIEQAQEILAQD